MPHSTASILTAIAKHTAIQNSGGPWLLTMTTMPWHTIDNYAKKKLRVFLTSNNRITSN